MLEDTSSKNMQQRIIKKIKKLKAKEINRNVKVPDNKLIQYGCKVLNSYSPVSQETINFLLKKLYFCKEEFKKNGDIHNLMGRLYWYKIYLDRKNKIYTKEWLRKWKVNAIKSFKEAERRYLSNKYPSTIDMSIGSWKPESQIYSKKVTKLKYSSNKEAIQDIRKILQNL